MADEEFDIVLSDGWIIDGLGTAARRGSVGVIGDRIARVSDGPLTGRHTIDARGLVISPGFVDMHVHSDVAVFTDDVRESQVRQGVTTEVIGQDGLSYAPATPATLEVMRHLLESWNGNPDLGIEWDSVAEFLSHVGRQSRLNVAYLVPHGTVRHLVMGMSDRPASPEEIRQMARIVDQSLREGAFGLSAGLTYMPGMFATDDELIALCRIVKTHGGVFVPHHRNYGGGAIDAYGECLHMARKSGVSLHLAHAHLGFPKNVGRAGELLEMLNTALSDGLIVTLDSYPYGPAATSLAALLPSWVLKLDDEARNRSLSTRETQMRLEREMEEVGTPGHMGEPVDWSRVIVASVTHDELAEYSGQSLAQIAEMRGIAPGAALSDLLVADDLKTGVIVDIGNEENVREIAKFRGHTASSDGMFVGASPHPRGYGSMARFLGHYVRGEQLMSLEEMVRHMTSSPMSILSVRDRGVVREGFHADLCLFDPDTIADRATFVSPREFADGVDSVLINGKIVMEGGAMVPGAPGRALRHSSPPASGGKSV